MNDNFNKWGKWDIAAGHAILKSVGGYVTDFDGDEIDYMSINSYLDKGFVFSRDRTIISVVQ